MTFNIAVVHSALPKGMHGRNRAYKGADLYRGWYEQGIVSRVITSGREADDLAQIVLNNGTPENHIITENKSKTTYQNLRNLPPIFDKLSAELGKLESACLISQGWHKGRILYIARTVLDEYPYDFVEAIDGRSDEEIEAYKKMEPAKFFWDKAAMFFFNNVPVIGENAADFLNASGYCSLRVFSARRWAR